MHVKTLSLAGMQGMNSSLYLLKNDRGFGPLDMMAVLNKHITNAQKLVRTEGLVRLIVLESEERRKMSWNIAMGTSWLFGLANRFHIAVENETWEWFPGQCAYCAQAPCNCKNIPKADRPKMKRPPQNHSRPITFEDFQRMFERIYPNTLESAMSHLLEEFGEVQIAYAEYVGTHDDALFTHVSEEIIDMLTCFFALATALQFNLAEEMEMWFARGCPGCLTSPCTCSYPHTIAQIDSKK